MGPVAQQIKQTQGKEVGVKYVAEVLEQAKATVERSQSRRRDRGMER